MTRQGPNLNKRTSAQRGGRPTSKRRKFFNEILAHFHSNEPLTSYHPEHANDGFKIVGTLSSVEPAKGIIDKSLRSRATLIIGFGIHASEYHKDMFVPNYEWKWIEYILKIDEKHNLEVELLNIRRSTVKSAKHGIQPCFKFDLVERPTK